MISLRLLAEVESITQGITSLMNMLQASLYNRHGDIESD